MQLGGRLVLAGGACLIAILLAACGSGGSSPLPSFSPPPPAPDFSLSVSSGSISVEQGATSGAVTVAVNPNNDFTGSVSIAVEGLPAGVTSSPASPFSVAAGQSQQVSFSVPASVGASDYTITFGGTSGALSHSATLTLTVMPMPLSTCTLMGNPTAITQGESAQLSWSTSGAATASINQGIGNVALPSGSVTVSPTATTIYTMTVQNAAGVSSTCQATVKVFADFELILPTAVSLSANGSKTQTGRVKFTTLGSGTEPFEVTISFASLPQAVTVTPTSQTVAPGSTFTFTLSASKDAPAVSAFPVTGTATRVSDGVVRTAEFLLTVTRIELGDGFINFIPTDTSDFQWSAEAASCFTQFMAVAYPALEAVAGKPSTTIDVAVKVPSLFGLRGAFIASTNEIHMGLFPDTTGGCDADPPWYTLFVHEATHAFHDGFWDLLFEQPFPAFMPYDEHPSTDLVMVTVSHYLQRKGLWNLQGDGGLMLAGDAYNDVGADALGGVLGSHGGPTEVFSWLNAGTIDLLLLHLGQSACLADEATADWEIDCDFHRRLYDRLYAFMNAEQRFFTQQEFIDMVGAESSEPMDGIPARGWYANRSATSRDGIPGNYFGVATFQRVVPEGNNRIFVRLLATTLDDTMGFTTKTPITSGSAFIEWLDVDGNVVFSTTHDLSVSHDVSLDTSALPPGAYTVKATLKDLDGNPFLDKDGNPIGPRTNVFMVVPFQHYWDGTTSPGTYVIATQLDADGNLQAVRSTFSVTPVWSANGAALVGDSCGNLNPCSTAVNGVDITVPLPLPRIVAVPAIP